MASIREQDCRNGNSRVWIEYSGCDCRLMWWLTAGSPVTKIDAAACWDSPYGLHTSTDLISDPACVLTQTPSVRRLPQCPTSPLYSIHKDAYDHTLPWIHPQWEVGHIDASLSTRDAHNHLSKYFPLTRGLKRRQNGGSLASRRVVVDISKRNINTTLIAPLLTSHSL